MIEVNPSTDNKSVVAILEPGKSLVLTPQDADDFGFRLRYCVAKMRQSDHDNAIATRLASEEGD